MVVDTSALMAILLGESRSDDCISALDTNAAVLISAGTLAECLIVADRKGVGAQMAILLQRFGFVVADVTAPFAQRVADAYRRWGKGQHPAGLNLGDCFAYALAEERALPLLYVGGDFAKTDVQAVL